LEEKKKDHEKQKWYRPRTIGPRGGRHTKKGGSYQIGLGIEKKGFKFGERGKEDEGAQNKSSMNAGLEDALPFRKEI